MYSRSRLLRLFSFSLSNLDSATVLAWFVVDLTTGFDKLHKTIISRGNGLEERIVDVSELGCLLLRNFVLVDLLFDGLDHLFGLSLRRVELLLTLGFTLKD